VGPLGAELQASELTSGLKALAPLALLLITDREQLDRRVSEVSLTEGGECHMRHLLNGIINIASNDGSCPWFHGVTGIST
jgi:hypothetical protein